MLLRELGIKEVVFEPHLTGQDRTMFTEELKKKKTDPAEASMFIWNLSGFTEPFVGKNTIKLKRLCQVSVT